MKTNQGVIVLIDHSADHSRVQSVLHDWGYSEKEIQRLISEMTDRELDQGNVIA